MAMRRVLTCILSAQRVTFTRTAANALRTSAVASIQRLTFSTDRPIESPIEPCYEKEVITLPCVKKLIEKSNIQLFDVRSREEIEETGKIPGSTNIPLDELKDAFSMSPEEFEEKYNVPKPKQDDNNITFHCRTGIRAQNAIEVIQQLGYDRTHNFTGGWSEWQEAIEADITRKESG